MHFLDEMGSASGKLFLVKLSGLHNQSVQQAKKTDPFKTDQVMLPISTTQHMQTNDCRMKQVAESSKLGNSGGSKVID